MRQRIYIYCKVCSIINNNTKETIPMHCRLAFRLDGYLSIRPVFSTRIGDIYHSLTQPFNKREGVDPEGLPSSPRCRSINLLPSDSTRGSLVGLGSLGSRLAFTFGFM